MKYVYPAIFRQEDCGGYSVRFPDIKQGATQGNTMAEAMEMAQDFLAFALYELERDGKQIPHATELSKIAHTEGDIISLVNIDTDYARRWHEKRTVRKNVTIPSWLNERAEAANVNFSQELQSRLKEVLKVG